MFSPLSISLAVSLLLLGSDQTARQQLENALGIVKHEELFATLKELNSKYEGMKIKISKAVCPSKTSPMWANFKCDNVYAIRCEIQLLDYEKYTEHSKTVVNEIVEDHTDGKIIDLFSSMDPKTECVIVSYIYFKGD